MAQFEHRSTDDDDVRVFDGGEDEEDTEGSHLPVVMVIAVLVLAAFAGVVWLAYNQGVARGRNDVPVRVAAQETNAGAPKQIKVYQQPAGADEDTDQLVSPPSNKPAAVQPAQRTQAAQSKPASSSIKIAEANTPSAVLTVKRTPDSETPELATAPPAQLGLATPAKPTATAVTAPKSAPTVVVATPVSTKPVATKPVPAGAFALQIGAYKSQGEAMGAWKTYLAKHATLLAGFRPDILRADLGDKGVWYRLRVASFADKKAAEAMCERLKAEGGACFLAR
jgi:cell division protein FtsN